jgi:hypothetical protein
MGFPPQPHRHVTSIDGVSFADVLPDRLMTAYGNQAVSVIGRAHLIVNKRATGRPQDALDAELLERR